MREPKTNLPEIEKKYLPTHKPSERTLFVATKVKRVLSVSLDFFIFCVILKKNKGQGNFLNLRMVHIF